jgi:EAL domain-containing protein (putative c-di-GMP-specific phosphodiesterase class I)
MVKQAYLESYIGVKKIPRRFDLDNLPAIIGRHPDCCLQLNVDRISRKHARIDTSNGQLVVTDLDSTNGTFVNHQRIGQTTPITNGDVLHFAGHEFRLIEERQSGEKPFNADLTLVGIKPLTRHFPTQVKEFRQLMTEGLVCSYRQSIIDRQGNPYGFELLGRGIHPQLDSGAKEIFALARAFDEEVALSELLRRKSFAEASAAGLDLPLFFNTHPKECLAPERLLKELRKLRAQYPELKLVLEVHEAAVTDLAMMAGVRAALREINIGLAYDDFGAGRSRLLELVEVPPDYLKFDKALISGITGPNSRTYKLVSTFNSLAQEMGIKTLAEGIETEAMAETCTSLGIDCFQGYLYDHPEPIIPPTAKSHGRP